MSIHMEPCSLKEASKIINNDSTGSKIKINIEFQSAKLGKEIGCVKAKSGLDVHARLWQIAQNKSHTRCIGNMQHRK